MFKMLKPAALVSLALIAGSASAAKIEFDGLVGEGAVKTYRENGYVMTANKGKDLVAQVTTDAELFSSGFSFAATAANKNQDFDLDSFFMDFGTAVDVKLTYTIDGQDNTIDLADTSSGFFTVNKNEVFTFTGLDDLSSFSVQAYNNKGNAVSNAPFEIDSIKVTPDVAAVPEPGSLALMFAGLGIIGTLARRRRS